MDLLLGREHLSVFAVRSEEELAGYCIATAGGASGELDSLYIREKYRGTGLGDRLTRRPWSGSTAWIAGISA
jgi:ribosomal protein S18 acetylase RimI-like enzyme